MTDQKPVESLSYEEAVEELEQIVRSMESGQFALEKTLALFERGEQLAKQCADLLDKAELKVHKLSGTAEESSLNEG
jgi:exodeoxyribonuclease VII small subunit